MCKFFKGVFILTAALLVFCFSQNSFASMDGSRHLISPELLKSANLKLVWENTLPMKKNESMERMLILGDQIYLISSNNFTMSLNRQSGETIFYRNIAREGLAADGFNRYRDEILYYVGNRYIELEAASGIEKKITEVDYSIVCPVVRNSSFFYVSSVDKRLRVSGAEDRINIFKVASDNDSMITSVIANDDYVVFGTDKGNIYSMLPDSPKELWRFDAAGGLVGQIVRDSNSLYFSADDMKVYKINVPDMYTKKFIWKTLVPGMIQKAPRVTSTMVYQNVFSKDMSISAIDKDSGRIIWTLPGGTELLAESRGKAYIITNNAALVVMDNTSAKKIYSVNFTNVSRCAFNTWDSKIYIGDKSGRIACIEPLN